MGYWGQGKGWHLNLFTPLLSSPSPSLKEKVSLEYYFSKWYLFNMIELVPDKKSQENWTLASR